MSINFLQVSWNGKEDACYEESVEKTASERTEGRNWKIPGGSDPYDCNDWGLYPAFWLLTEA